MFAAPGAYDRTITIFSPDGRLFQVEYALETVNRGATILGIVCSEGVVLGAEEKIETKLQDTNFTWKLYEIDDHLGAAVVGLGSDARILIDQARVYSQSNRLMYDEAIDVEIITKRVGDIKQLYTQHGGVRPFGVSIIFGGVDKTGNRIFATDPSGSYRSFKAVALGIGRETVENILKEEYRENLNLEEAIKLAVRCLTKALEARGEPKRIKISVIPSSTKRLKTLSDEEIETYQQGIEGSGT
ncbi:MAG: archaeal proteasome endopeptidase complex subunit alpha [Candidatus Bathyarchaeota archaeon]|nr:archaeal proteasome endopeptidase complex subunit alpha [Candidatus Bathyarchaeota archaeon]MDH5419860.1 archaeal proteasome endopeptidase complex subunit alpha [Candidatus Bathyarchaeota archaeon]MDH5624388.1 archaeal proteasome endopeptidase complex subunit alpha [Candidatus Bathyarchaeota archaeon]MDH5636638.1 archaeal proteasome endopeptidase complex subunit alpha [Candidatus Bathyarchaeota archaeon]MDH5701999.1 archaeal proteasome endopeptidase complex subunit alpha [Candidatus Bathyarc